jgi:hypothetical protein
MSTSGGVGGRGPRGPLLPDCKEDVLAEVLPHSQGGAMLVKRLIYLTIIYFALINSTPIVFLPQEDTT